MNIVTSQAATAPSTSASDTTGAASRIAPDSDYGTDAAGTPGAEPRTFGDVLSNRLAHGKSSDAAGGDGGTAGDDPAAVATRPDRHAATTRERMPAAAVDVALAGTKDTATVVDAKGSAKDDGDDTADDADGSADPIGTDLAAQLALVSQWAALARPAAAAATPTADTGAVHGASRDPFDVRGKLDTVRATTQKVAGVDGAADGTAATAAAATGAAAPAQASAVGTFDAWTMGARLTERASTRTDRAAPTVGAASSATSATSATSTTPGAALLQTTATDQTATTFDRLMAIAGGSTGATPDAASAAILAAHATSARVDGTSVASSDPLGSREIRETVGTAAWGHEVGQATVRMAANDLQNVSLKLNPEHLGPLDVQMRVDNGVASLQFTATHADTRHAIESSRATLDQMLGEQGIKLGDWSVGQQSSDPSANRSFDMSTGQRDGQRQSSGNGSSDEPVVTTTVVARSTSGLGLVDTFA